MIVWGGFAGSSTLADGGIFDGATSSWTALSATGAPAKRDYHSAIWTGTKMIVWGGYDFVNGTPMQTIWRRLVV